MRIPRIIHRVWLGGEPMCDDFQRYGETWREQHPGWEMRLWTDDDLPRLTFPNAFERGRHHAERSDLVRYELMKQYGGVYVDTDFDCVRSIEPLLGFVEAFAAYQTPARVCNALLGAVPGHPLFVRAVEVAATRIGRGPVSWSTGPRFFTELVKDFPVTTLFPPEQFYPYLWSERHRRGEPFADAYAVHHWAASWR